MLGDGELSANVAAHTDGDKISILIADDHPLLRQALRSVLEKQADLKIVAEANDGEEVIKLTRKYNPDIVIMDISMPILSGLEATRQIKASNPRTIILVLTVYDDSEHIFGLLEAGAAGYLTKSIFGEEIIHAIRSLAAGEAVLSAPVLKRIIKENLPYSTKPVTLDNKEKLSVRELEILKLASIGMNNKEIATKLGLSLFTVKGYMVDIFSKLNVNSRTEAVVTSVRLGLIHLSDME